MEQILSKLKRRCEEQLLGLGEVGSIPKPEIFRKQPRWTWFMIWGNPSSFWKQNKELRAIYKCEDTLTLDGLPWIKMTEPKIYLPILK